MPNLFPCRVFEISQGRKFAHRARKAKKGANNRKNVWTLETWNVKSMVDTEGPVEVVRAMRGERRER